MRLFALLFALCVVSPPVATAAGSTHDANGWLTVPDVQVAEPIHGLPPEYRPGMPIEEFNRQLAESRTSLANFIVSVRVQRSAINLNRIVDRLAQFEVHDQVLTGRVESMLIESEGPWVTLQVRVSNRTLADGWVAQPGDKGLMKLSR